jgi:hypothetical protein
MPAFEVEFEVYCGTCGNGLCRESDTRKSRNRGENQVVVNVCPKCMKEKQEEIEDLQNQIDKLNETIQDLQSREE